MCWPSGRRLRDSDGEALGCPPVVIFVAVMEKMSGYTPAARRCCPVDEDDTGSCAGRRDVVFATVMEKTLDCPPVVIFVVVTEKTPSIDLLADARASSGEERIAGRSPARARHRHAWHVQGAVAAGSRACHPWSPPGAIIHGPAWRVIGCTDLGIQRWLRVSSPEKSAR